jgi:hypothetical protein
MQADLRGEIVRYQEAIVSLKAQKAALQRQIDALAPNAALRGDLNAEMLKLDATMVRHQMGIAGDEARLAMDKTATEVGVPPTLPPLPSGRPLIDPAIVSAVVVFIAVAIVLPISVGITRRLWRRAPKDTMPQALDKVLPRLDRIEQAIDAIAIEVERISEGQRFVTKALAERPVQVNPAAPHGVSDASGLGDAKPFLALGAGPIEPIRVAERQAVRQSITPH